MASSAKKPGESWTQCGERYARAAVLGLACLLLALVVFYVTFQVGWFFGWAVSG